MRMGFQVPGFRTFENFFESVQYSDPAFAELIHDDMVTIALGGISADRTSAYEAVRRLRARVDRLPMIHVRILDNALEELGYDFKDIYNEEAR